MNPALQYPIYKRIVGQDAGLPHDPNDPEYTYTASALDLALQFLFTQEMKQAMADMVKEFDANLPVPVRRFQGRPDSYIHAWVDQFLNILRHQGAPIVFINYELPPDNPASHPRQEWDGDTFNPRGQMVYVSQGFITAMVNARTNPPLFRRYQFKLMHVLAHEIGAHVLITYIYHGRPLTPPDVVPFNWASQPQYDRVPGDETPPQVGESGRFLEQLAFGGTVEFFNRPEPATPYIVDRWYRGRRITQHAIDAVVILRAFTTQYQVVASVDVDDLVEPGAQRSRSSSPRPLTPADRLFIQRAKVKPIRYFISRQLLAQVPGDPRILAERVQA